MKKKIIATFLLSSALLFTGCTKYVKNGTVKASVVNKTYITGYWTPIIISCGKTTVIAQQYTPDCYETKLKYNDLETVSLNEALYKKVKIGDKIKVEYFISEDGEKRKIEYVKK